MFKIASHDVAKRLALLEYHEAVIVNVYISKNPQVTASFVEFNTDKGRSIFDKVKLSDDYKAANINGLNLEANYITYITNDPGVIPKIQAMWYNVGYTIRILKKDVSSICDIAVKIPRLNVGETLRIIAKETLTADELDVIRAKHPGEDE